jgi:hypothetical protein
VRRSILLLDSSSSRRSAETSDHYEVVSVRNVVRALGGLFACTIVAFAGKAAPLPLDGDNWCGTKPGKLAAELALHADYQRRLARDIAAGKRVRAAGPAATSVGDVAVIEDDGTILVPQNDLDVADHGFQFVPQKKGGYVTSPFEGGVDGSLGDRLALGDDDTALISFPKGFSFRFFGKAYTSMFVQSDGNITLGEQDHESSARDLGRMIAGPPRIAPVFEDFNPETASGDGGVYLLVSKTRIIVTWFDLPRYGTNNHNTFQAVLYPSKGKVDGKITFALGGLDTIKGIVGIAPGNGADVQLLDLTNDLPNTASKEGVVERFASTTDIDHLAIAKIFFRQFADVYDHLIVWLDFSQSLGRAFAFELTVKNDIRGIGDDVYDSSSFAGSKGRLRSYLQMGSLSRYPDDPNALVQGLGTNTTLDVMGQEAGHRWLALLHFKDENGQSSDELLGRSLSHWSFCFNSLASDMEGNEIEPSGDHFQTVAATERYSPLDQYAIGLIGPEEVPPFWYVDGCIDRAAAPQVGIGIFGNRHDVTIQQIIAAEGPRVPPADKAPHSFNMAFVVVGTQGHPPSDAAIAKVDRIRAAWETYFAEATDGRGSVDTTLKHR